ncbi:DUF3320 domain-containing protein [Cryobacterium sp. TMT1-66-1]|uniref:DUF3320 domain-containing protein n=1 Tax=Cryobacterium sp. TMT1-66-1 TaxID=1259242 RepID=UPI00106B70CA|nr:DUF3320 domain-containing protein [Cryobacterium sp. TMT1-66-1]TFD05523.1 DUF3320 domain-containing protein [Cryobacterium sp. TMT1-66-1]
MSEIDYHATVGDALGLLIEGLQPFVERVFATKLPPEVSWTSVLERKDHLAGRRGGIYSPRDLSLLLRALTERMGELGYPFDQELPRQGQTYASELREVRNQWAHTQEFTAQTAYRALDSAELLLKSIGADAQAQQVSELKASVLPVAPAPRAFERADDERSSRDDHSDSLASERLKDPDHSDRREAPPAATAHLTITSVPFLSYAMAHCRVPIVDEVVIENLGGEARGASLEVDVVTANGSLGGPKVLLADLGEKQSTVLRAIDLILDPARMLAVEEQRPGVIRATLRDSAGTTLAEASVDVTVLAYNQWVATPLHLGLELLASHVQPNSAAIAPLLREASDLLQASTGDSSLTGYQTESTQRVDDTVAAIWDAMRARDIRYAEPPASWGNSGQKVRTPEEVLVGRLGTCLDTTVTLAAALEQAGLNSTMWLLQGHIFLGYWRIDSSLGAIALTDVADIVNLVDLGSIGLLETTAVTGGTESKSFAEAGRIPRTVHLAAGLDRFYGVTDIRQARESRIFPLPSRSTTAEGEVTVTVYQPAPGRAIDPYYGKNTTDAAPGSTTVPARVSQWKNALLDLSLRNKLINYTDRSGYSLAVPAPAVARLEDAISAGTPITLLPSDAVPKIDEVRGIRFGRDLPEDVREILLADKKSAFVDITQAAYTTKLRYLANKARTVVEETGANNLYLAFGMLHWTFNDRELRSPLVLIPVNMTSASRGTSYKLTIDDAGASTPNYCLLEKLRLSFGLEIPGLANPADDGSGIDLHAAFTAVREAIATAGLPFRVEETVDLSILQFAKFRLWKDLDENWETLSQNSLVSHLINSPTAAYADPVSAANAVDLDELGGTVPVPADSSQLEAVAEAVHGRTFVLEGPPGTGKSQTITNLLARSLAAGKRVLFVAEKRAALDVVKKRLESVGLGDFSLDLHDKSARPAAVRAQIRAALDLHIQPDTAALQTNLEAATSSRGALARYADRLHEVNAAGLSLYGARTNELAADADVTALEIPATLVAGSAPEAFAELRQVLRSLPEVSDLARPSPTHPWGFVDERATHPLDVAAIHTAARAFDGALVAAETAGFSLEALNRRNSAALIGEWSDVSAAPRYPLPIIDSLHGDDWKAHLTALEQQLATVTATPPGWLVSVKPTALARDLPAIHAAAVAADEAGFFGRKKKRRAVLALFADDLEVDSQSVPLKTLSTLTGALAASHAAATSLRGAALKLPVPLVDVGWNPYLTESAAKLAADINWLRWIGDALNPQGVARIADLRQYYAASAVGAGQGELERLEQAWTQLATAADLDSHPVWAGDLGFTARWTSTRAARNVAAARPVPLERWLALVRHLEPLIRSGLLEARASLLDGRIPADDAALAFDKGVAVASISEREDATALGDFNIIAHNKTIGRFTTSTGLVRAELPRAIPAEVLALRRFDTTVLSGQVGGLRRQLDRQRGGMSVRALLQNYGELITQVMPCTLMSPESVARFFPAQAGLFDIVVFDEASQIRVADAIGAMGRAASVVVVGDSKQMPPTSFAEASASIDDEVDTAPEVVVDEESILTECVNARVSSKWLSWHYRSQDESLIAFSNHYYYESRLSSFPAPVGAGATGAGHGVSLVRVNGQFERSGKGKTLRTNLVEATAIVDDIQRRFRLSPGESPSVGVITFNAQQRNLIENMLRDSPDERLERALDEPDGLFVKNLENVQGDERDSILFSIAFSANDKGVVPLNFGPLSRAGGERRLNVAITRARREVVLFASFDPGVLRAQDTSSVGIKHLKAYLEMADRGAAVMHDDVRRQSVVDRHRDDIAAELRGRGFAVQTDVGLSEFRVDISIADASAPDHPLVAVLLDGPNWRARLTVSDRDGLPVDVLQGLMRWPGVERVWMPEWLHQREETLDRLAESVRVAAQRPSAPIPVTVPSASVSVPPPSAPIRAAAKHPSQVELPSPLRGRPVTAPSNPLVVPYFEWQPSYRGSVSVLDELPRSSARVQAVIRDVVAAEGPVHSVRLAKLVASEFGLDRVAQARAAAILRCVPPELQRSTDEPFHWPTDIDPATWLVARRTPLGGVRLIDHVSLLEIANAMRQCAASAAGMDETELKREALSLFGGRRVTEAIGQRLDAGLIYGLKSRRLERAGSGVVVSGPLS